MGIDIAPYSFFWISLLLLTVPLKWLLAAFLAAAVHECCHILLIRILGHKIWTIQIGITGTVIHTEPMPRAKELICALAGPVGSLLLAMTIHIMPRVALCAAVQGIYNLIPVYPMDGGRIFRCVGQLLFPLRWSDKLCALLERIILLVIGVIGLIAAVQYDIGLAPVLFASILLIKTFPRKIPCKAKHLRVQ